MDVERLSELVPARDVRIAASDAALSALETAYRADLFAYAVEDRSMSVKHEYADRVILGRREVYPNRKTCDVIRAPEFDAAVRFVDALGAEVGHKFAYGDVVGALSSTGAGAEFSALVRLDGWGVRTGIVLGCRLATLYGASKHPRDAVGAIVRAATGPRSVPSEIEIFAYTTLCVRACAVISGVASREALRAPLYQFTYQWGAFGDEVASLVSGWAVGTASLDVDVLFYHASRRASLYERAVLCALFALARSTRLSKPNRALVELSQIRHRLRDAYTLAGALFSLAGYEPFPLAMIEPRTGRPDFDSLVRLDGLQ